MTEAAGARACCTVLTRPPRATPISSAAPLFLAALVHSDPALLSAGQAAKWYGRQRGEVGTRRLSRYTELRLSPRGGSWLRPGSPLCRRGGERLLGVLPELTGGETKKKQEVAGEQLVPPARGKAVWGMLAPQAGSFPSPVCINRVFSPSPTHFTVAQQKREDRRNLFWSR